MTQFRLALLGIALLACQTPAGEKGGLVRLQASEAELAKAYAPHRFALLVGISTFSDSHWRDLRFPAKDARDLGEALQDVARGHFDQVRTLTGAEQTTREAILAALHELRKTASGPDDVVVVYFSAHGTLARDGRGELQRYLVTSDARFADIPGTALAMEQLKQEFEQLTSRRRVLVLATCHSGSGKSLLPDEVTAELASLKSGFYARPLEEASRASVVLSASDWGEAAREDEQLQNDIYTHFLVEGLGGQGDRNGDGAVSATEAHDYARRRTYAYTGGRQRPSAEILEVGADPIILSGQVSQLGHPELYSYAAHLDGFTLKVDGESRTELPGGAAVTPGRRTVELTKGDQVLLKSDVDLAAGERIDLETLVMRSQPHRSLSLVGGMLSFVDQKSRSELLPATFCGGLSLRFDGAIAPRLALQLDLGAGAGRQMLRLGSDQVPFSYRDLSLGASAPYTLFSRGAFTLHAGPRVAALWLQRSFDLDAFRSGQSYLTVSPGLTASAGYALAERLELTVQASLMLTYVMVDGAGQVLGFTGTWAGMGYRF